MLRAIAFALVSVVLAVPALATLSRERVPLEVVINGQAKAAVVGWLSQEQNLWIAEKDVASWGITTKADTSIDGRPVVALESLGERVRFDPSLMRLVVTLTAKELANQTRVDLLKRRSRDAQAVTHSDGLLMDYEIGVGHFGSSSALDASVRTRAAQGGWQLLDDRSATIVKGKTLQVPWRTTVRRDWLQESLRLDIGTLVTPDGGLANWGEWRGVSFGTAHYGYNSLAATRPSTSMATTVLYPSTADIYVNGVKQGTYQVSPGAFDVRGLRGYSAGATEVKAVIRDVYGQETVLQEARYLGENVLAKGTHEYQYQVGQDQYRPEDGLQLRAAHRLGVSDNWTVIARAQARKDAQAVQFGAVTQIDGVGEVGANLLAGHADGPESLRGFALTHSWRTGVWGVSTALSSRPTYVYRADGVVPSIVRELASQVTYSTGGWGNFDVRASIRRFSGSDTLRELQLGWSKNLTQELFAQVFVRHSTLAGNAVHALLAWHPQQGYSVSSYTDVSQGSISQQLTTSKQPGYGPTAWRLDTRSQDGRASAGAQVEHTLQAGIAKASVQTNGSTGSARVAWNGGLMANSLGMRTASSVRNDAAAVIQVAGIADVHVFRNGTPVGKTDENGQLWVGELPGYEEVRFSLNESDLPMDTWYAGGAVKSVRVAPGSVAAVTFDVRRFRTVTLQAQDCTGQCTPLADQQLVIDSEGGVSATAAVRGGRAIVEGLLTGAHAVQTEDGSCAGTVQVEAAGAVLAKLKCTTAAGG